MYNNRNLNPNQVRRFLCRTRMSYLTMSGMKSIEWFIEDQVFSPSHDSAPPTPPPPIFRQQVVYPSQSCCVPPVECTDGGWEVGEEPIIRWKESLFLYKLFYSLVGPNHTIKIDNGSDDDKLTFLFCHLQWILWNCLASQPLGRHATRQVVELVQNRFCEEHVEAALSLHQRVPSQLVDEILPSKRTCLEMYQSAGWELKESYDHNTITGYCSLAPVPSPPAS